MSTALMQSCNTHTTTTDHHNPGRRQQHGQRKADSAAYDDLSTTAGSPVPDGCDRKARKKDQNRRAAYNYRRKKSEEKNRLREEEMRLVYSRVCLVGYADQIEGLILYILNTKTRKTLDGDGNTAHFICPLCQEACDNILDLRAHLRLAHQSHEYDLTCGGDGGNGNTCSEHRMTGSCNMDSVNNYKFD